MSGKNIHLKISYEGVEKFQIAISQSELKTFLIELKRKKFYLISFNKPVDIELIKESDDKLMRYYIDNLNDIQIIDALYNIEVQGGIEVDT
jgi:hypothetical protein